MSKNKLILVPDYRFYKDMRDKTQSIIDSTPEEELDNNSWWYLHGELESETTYDKGHFINCKSAGYSVETIYWSTIYGDKVAEVRDENNLTIHKLKVDGEIPVEVVGFPNRPAIFVGFTTDFRWIYYKGVKYPYWNQRGYAVFADDTKALSDAREYRAKRAGYSD